MNISLKAGCITAGFSFEQPDLQQHFMDRYGMFTVEYRDGEPLLHIKTEVGLKPGYSSELVATVAGDVQRIDSASLQFEYNIQTGQGTLVVSPDREQFVDSLENALRVAVQFLAINNGALILHAAAVGVNGEVVIIPAGEGGGKTTLSTRCRKIGLELYGDDLVMVKPETNGVTVAPLPFYGESTNIPFEETSGCLYRTVFISKGTGLTVEKLTIAEVVAMLAANTPFLQGRPQAAAAAALRISTHIAAVGAVRMIYDLESSPENQIQRMLSESLADL